MAEEILRLMHEAAPLDERYSLENFRDCYAEHKALDSTVPVPAQYERDDEDDLMLALQMSMQP